MVTLLDRIIRSDEAFSGHQFAEITIAYILGSFTLIKARTELEILGGSQDRIDQRADFDEFKTKYDAFPDTEIGRDDRGIWIMKVLVLTNALQLGHESKAQYNTDLGLTLDTT